MLDIKNLLSDHHIPFKTSGRNISHGWIGTSCIFCGDSSNHLGINEDGFYNCWRCGKKGHISYLLSVLLKKPVYEIERILIDYETYTDVLDKKTEIVYRDIEPKNLLKEWHIQYYAYLRRRNYDWDTIRNFSLKCFNVYGEWAWRIYIPVFLEGKLVNYLGRTVREGESRYKNCKNEDAVIPMKNLLYNVDSVRDTVIIVEGVTDVWRIGSGCVATFGVQFTDKQINILYERKVQRAFVMYDNEHDAQKQAEKLANQLSIFCKTEILIPDTDPSEMSLSDVRSLRNLL